MEGGFFGLDTVTPSENTVTLSIPDGALFLIYNKLMVTGLADGVQVLPYRIPIGTLRAFIYVPI